MKDLALVVVSVALTALLGRPWGNRRLLHHVQEQLDVLKSLPDDWEHLRRALEELAARDIARYIKLRTATVSFPIHRLMNRGMDAALVGALIALFANMSFVPGSDAVKEWVTAGGVTLAAVAITTNLVVLLRRRQDLSEELTRSAPRQ